MKLLPIALALLVAGTAHAQNWLTDHAAAVRAAQEQKKPLLMFFTGSDWCSWCKKLNAEVLSTQEFQAYANTKLILMEVDFPRGKPQPKELQEQNNKLQEQYQIEGYPTVIIVDADGKPKGSLGYKAGGPKAWLAEVDKIIK